jgi:hypothetical protein
VFSFLLNELLRCALFNAGTRRVQFPHVNRQIAVSSGNALFPLSHSSNLKTYEKHTPNTVCIQFIALRPYSTVEELFVSSQGTSTKHVHAVNGTGTQKVI